jgi:hypothetical protein
MLRSRRIQPANLATWLKETISRTRDGRYAHRLLLEQPASRDIVTVELSACIQEAHDDARRRLREALEPTLSPFATRTVDPTAGYPEDLHVDTLMGYFGEILAGVIAEQKDVHGERSWRVPVFLFRFHNVAFQKLGQRRDLAAQAATLPDIDADESKIPGRTGDDVLAFVSAPGGDLAGILVCEAKCLSSHHSATAEKAHQQLSTAARCPSGIFETIEALKDYRSDEARVWRERLMAFYFDPSKKVARSDMLLYATGNRPRRPASRTSWIPQDRPLPEYAGKRRLEVVEVYLDNPSELVKSLYRPAS